MKGTRSLTTSSHKHAQRQRVVQASLHAAEGRRKGEPIPGRGLNHDRLGGRSSDASMQVSEFVDTFLRGTS